MLMPTIFLPIFRIPRSCRNSSCKGFAKVQQALRCEQGSKEQILWQERWTYSIYYIRLLIENISQPNP